MNQIHIVGHVGQDAKTGQTQTGKSFSQFSVAVSDDYKQGEEWVKRSYWLNVVAWGNIAKPYTKGQKLSISGKLTSREYEKDGQKRTTFEIVANEIHSIEREARTDSAPPPTENTGTPAPQQQAAPVQQNAPANDDLPF